MKSTRYDGYWGKRLARNQAKGRLYQVMNQELTDRQREILTGYYLDGKTIPQLAAELGVNKSTISRTLNRGEIRLRRFLKY